MITPDQVKLVPLWGLVSTATSPNFYAWTANNTISIR